MKDYSNLDGEVVDYQILSGLSNVQNNPLDSQNFYPMDGGEKHSNFRIFGIGKPSAGQIERQENRQERREEKQDFKMQKKEDRNERKNTRAGAKATQAQSQLEIAKSLSAPDATAAALAALGGGTKDTNEGMSTGMKIGIAVLVLGVVGFIGYKVYKAKKK